MAGPRPASTRRTAPRPILVALLAGLLTLLVACAGNASQGSDPKKDAGPEPVSIEAGDCFGGDMLAGDAAKEAERIGTDQVDALRDDPTWRDSEACDENHRLEVYAVVELPPRLDARITEYADLLATDGQLYLDVRQAVNTACSRTLRGVPRALKASNLRLDISPAINSDVAELAWNAVPFENWEAGQRRFACMLTQAEPGTHVMGDFFSAKGDSALHLCFDKESQAVACSEPHTLESLAIITANRAVAAGQLPGDGAFVDGKLKIGQENWDKLDRACTAFLDANSRAHRGLTGLTSVYDNQWPVPPNENYSFYCDATSPYGTRPKDLTVTTASVFDR